MHTSYSLIDKTYRSHFDCLVNYILKRTGCRDTSRDIAQSAFLHLLSYDGIIDDKGILSLLFTFSHNIICDIMRRDSVAKAHREYLLHSFCEGYDNVMQNLLCKDILSKESERVEMLSPQRRKVYLLTREQGKSPREIAAIYKVSPRTVERQLLCARKEIRAYLRHNI